jgi:eukaryotic-like serine/threonine-protein kinase
VWRTATGGPTDGPDGYARGADVADSQNELLGDRYRLRTRIGSGGMAVVWLARDERLRRDVAVKVLSDAMAFDPSHRKRFDREARIAAGVSHPNLVKVYDYGSGEEHPYLVLEYIEGETLARRLEGGSLSPSETELLATEVLGALAAIHAAGVVHRDVKPSNILLDRDRHAHLTDFGIARMAEATDLTQTGHVIGTLGYMAPEVREGGPATPRSDLYSCGIVLRECLPAGSSSGVGELITRLTATDPNRRPASAEAALKPDHDPTAPTELTPNRGPGRRAIVVAALGLAIAGAILAVALSAGGGGSPQAGQKRAAHHPTTQTTTVTQTSTASTPVTTVPPTSTPTVAASPPGSSTADRCAQLDAKKHALDERKHAIDERLKDNHAAKDAAHLRLDTQKHALDEQLKSCKK